VIRAVVFDVDGVLTSIDSIWRFIHERLGSLEAARENARRYYSGEISYEEWARLDTQLWRGVSAEEIASIVESVPIRRGAREAIAELKRMGLVTAAISAGLDVITERVRRELGLDHAFSNRLVVRGGVVTGEVVVDVRADNKGEVLERFCELAGVEPGECAVVGDGEVDVPMFKLAGLSVAFNPRSPEVADSADVAIFSEDLRAVVPVIAAALREAL